MLKQISARIGNFLPKNPQICRLLHSEQKLNVKGVNLNYVQSGGGSKSVLLLPGALGSAWTDFRPQIEKLPQLLPDYNVIAWDPPGYGKSIPPKRKFDLDFFHHDAQSAVDLMLALGHSKFSVLGWSDGGITGLIVAGGCGLENVEKLVIWGAGAYLNAEEVKSLGAMRDVQKWSAKMREPMERVYGKERFPELWGEWLDGVLDIYHQRGGDFCKKEVMNLRAPTFIVHGKKDVMVHPEHIPYLRERIKGHR